MHHVVLEHWSRRASFLHSRDARFKVVVLLAYLVVVSSLRPSAAALAGCALLVSIGVWLGRLPAGSLLVRAGIVLPFSGTFALFAWLSGDAARALMLLMRSYLSAWGVLLLAACTPLPEVLGALRWFRVPEFLVLVVQFLYRYLFVVSEQLQHMRLAAACRGGLSFRAASGLVATLFVRSYERAQGIHRAMLARAFEGRISWRATRPVSRLDWLFGSISLGLLIALRAIVESRA